MDTQAITEEIDDQLSYFLSDDFDNDKTFDLSFSASEAQELKKALALYEAIQKLEAWRKKNAKTRSWVLESESHKSLAEIFNGNDSAASTYNNSDSGDLIETIIALAAEVAK